MSPGIVVMRISIVWPVTVQYFGRMGVQMLLFVFISGMHAYVGLIPLFDFKQSKKLLTSSYPCNHALIDVLNIHFMISVCWVLMCCVAVCGLADTDLMVHIVASRLLISQRFGPKRHQFHPNRIRGQQPSTATIVRVLESLIKQSRMDLDFIFQTIKHFFHITPLQPMMHSLML